MDTKWTKEYRKKYNAKYWKKWRLKNKPYIKKICIICGKNFVQTGGCQKRCKKCQILKCKNCGKDFIPKKKNYKQKFCSRQCGLDFNYKDRVKRINKYRGTKPRTYHLKKRPKHGGIKYQEWRMSVWKRDKFTCQKCGKTTNELKKEGIKICADHIKPYCNYPELRYELSNGRTLCVPCHKKTKTYGIRAKFF